MKSKKGIQLNQSFGAVLTLVLVAILVILGIFIFVSLGTTFAGTSALQSQVNETVDMTIGGFGVVENRTLCGFTGFTVDLVQNNSGALIVIHPDNYSSTTNGFITNDTNEFTGVDGAGSWNVSWSGGTWGSAACTASDNMSTEFGNYTSLVGLVGTIIFLALVIGVLVASFAFGGRREV